MYLYSYLYMQRKTVQRIGRTRRAQGIVRAGTDPEEQHEAGCCYWQYSTVPRETEAGERLIPCRHADAAQAWLGTISSDVTCYT